MLCHSSHFCKVVGISIRWLGMESELKAGRQAGSGGVLLNAVCEMLMCHKLQCSARHACVALACNESGCWLIVLGHDGGFDCVRWEMLPAIGTEGKAHVSR